MKKSKSSLVKTASVLTKKFLEVDTLEKLSRAIGEILEQHLKVDVSGLYLFSETTNSFRLMQSSGLSSDEIILAQRFALSGFPGHVIRTRKQLHIQNLNSCDIEDLYSAGSNEIDSWLFYPIVDKEKIIGVLGAGRSGVNQFSDDDKEVLSFAVNLTALIYGNIRLSAALKREHSLLADAVGEKTESLKKAYEDLSNSSRYKDEFLSNMTHELKTPLSTVMGLSAAVLEGIYGPLNDKQTNILQTVHNSGQQLLSLINDILDIARIRSGKMSCSPEKHSLNNVCQKALEFVEEKIKSRAISIQLDCKNVTAFVWADLEHVERIVSILLDNAVDYSPKCGVVGIDVQTTDNRTSISVFSEERPEFDQADFEEPLSPADKNQAMRLRGSGLGLSLAKQLAELNGGGLRLRSSDKHELILSLPSQRPGENSKASLSSDHKSSCRVLYAEDNPHNVRTVTDYLESFGMTVISAEDGVQAIDLAAGIRPDVILMDMQMPRMDGLEATKKIKSNQQTKNIPIIALTAFASKQDRDACKNAGCCDFLSKPVSMKTLVATIRSHLQS